mmetsp:Transcript_105253/g.339507  ORF Transcript_105253/g.339507 Transcript_105253/m.339507 type:complete len:244 (+) Transcript_105253:565-1296(+)
MGRHEHGGRLPVGRRAKPADAGNSGGPVGRRRSGPANASTAARSAAAGAAGSAWRPAVVSLLAGRHPMGGRCDRPTGPAGAAGHGVPVGRQPFIWAVASTPAALLAAADLALLPGGGLPDLRHGPATLGVPPGPAARPGPPTEPRRGPWATGRPHPLPRRRAGPARRHALCPAPTGRGGPGLPRPRPGPVLSAQRPSSCPIRPSQAAPSIGGGGSHGPPHGGAGRRSLTLWGTGHERGLLSTI